ncbi:hypothetical protein COM86_09440 [Priestia megaterium]|jgi:hypothetical protein|nr:hypothetical protein COM86_09440 [Priestia megaterium]PEE76044.1 hypothetical protein COM81_08585 [Priestia megaterium]PFI93930.1 hypothetical protein COI84_17765 [Priestia megaterium]PGR07000.1 hypothetical protein COC62_19110 [Priestia megaterium]
MSTLRVIRSGTKSKDKWKKLKRRANNAYAGGVHGNAWIDTYNYDLLKARQIDLKDIINTNTKLKKVNNYIRNEMIARIELPPLSKLEVGAS